MMTLDTYMNGIITVNQILPSKTHPLIMDYNFINIDVQGYELEVFKGGKDTLNNIDYITTEVNRDEVYKDCAKIEELDTYLGDYGFQRVETTWDGGTWGDAFYIKNNG